jgi:phosphate ABC transporter phosphate-binding protein
MPEILRRLGAVLLSVAVLSGPLVAAGATPVAAAGRLTPISGTGSTWSQNALDQWKSNVKQYGMKVNYAGVGSTAGRANFRDGTVDFAVTEIPYGVEKNDDRPNRAFAYMPIVAGGTAFMYNLKIGGRRVTNLRLSGDVIAKIFTGRIVRWDDPAIKADNPGIVLPARKVVPVVRSDGSGTTAQFVTWLSKRHASTWQPYCASFGRQPNECAVTSFFPYRTGTAFVGQSGSLGVSGYVKQNQGEGAITYVEYSYATKNHFPVAKVLNDGGYYVEPKATNVAVALLKAQIDPADLTQKLDGVYSNSDKRTYPLSSYSYMIVPTGTTNGFTEDKGFTLGKFAYYFLCQGQQQAEVLGYSPLPVNLVQAGFTQVRKIKGVQAQSINVQSCNNPTFAKDGSNTLVKTAAYPPECDRKGGPTQCSTGTGGATEATPTKPGGKTTGTATGTAARPGATGAAVPGTTAGVPGTVPGTVAGGPAVVDPDTGQVVAGGAAGGDGQAIAAVPVSLDAARGWRLRHSMMLLSAMLLVLLVVGPPLLMRHLRVGGGAERDRP